MKEKKTILPALIVMLLWGSLFPVVKMGFEAYNIVSLADILYFAGVRFTICGAAVCLYVAITDRTSYKAMGKAIVPVLISGLFAIILHYSFTYGALKLTDSSKTAILKQIGALFYVCFSFLFFKEDRFTGKKLVGVLLGFAGIVAINASADGVSFNIGDALIVAASFCTIISNIISKKVFTVVEPIVSTGVSQFFGGIVLLIIGKVLGGNMDITLGASPVMLYICVASIFSYCIWFVVVKKSDLSKLFIIKFAEPVFACVFGALLLGENIFNVRYIVAFLLIAGGIYVSNK